MTRALIRKFAVSPSAAGLLAVGLVDAVGSGLYLAGGALFFTMVVGLSTAQVGIGLSVAGVLGILGPIPFGQLADRYSPRPVLVFLHLCCAAGFAAYVLVDDFVSFLVVAGLLGLAEQAARPMVQAILEQVVGAEHRNRMAAKLRVVHNVGYTLGALLAALALHVGTRQSFFTIMVGNAASFVLAAALLLLLRIQPHTRLPRTPAGTTTRKRLPALRDRWYMAAAGINALLLLHMTLLSVGVPLWIATSTHAPDSLIAALLVVNTALAVLLQLRAARGTEKVTAGAVAMRNAGLALALCCLCFASAAYLDSTLSVVSILLGGTVLLTWGELLQSAGQWSLSFGLAPLHSRVEYLATFHLGSSVQTAVGPALVTVGVIAHGWAGWAVLAAVFVLAGLMAQPLASRAARRPQLIGTSPEEIYGSTDSSRFAPRPQGVQH
ncbi:MFS transporter [Streptomyces griseorubiginosus]|uniref:MFS transporter n=1 Tax=Streptomyces griseorubiginosus TaxID=67304 RepID=UPI00076D2136|nr:MFS transporter [Streptomyces griseorubiginosus]KUM76863.1 hypothetical protein AQI84_15775 [Streptomyces griseorubiginosus]